jgi:hypothetical protein
MTGFAQDPFKGLAFTFRTLHFHGVVRLRDNRFEQIAALKTSKLKNGHKKRSKNTRFHDISVKL